MTIRIGTLNNGTFFIQANSVPKIKIFYSKVCQFSSVIYRFLSEIWE